MKSRGVGGHRLEGTRRFGEGRSSIDGGGDGADGNRDTQYMSENGHKIAFDPRDLSESAERSKQPKLTLMEEVLLLGLKDKQVRALYPPSRVERLTLTRATSPSGTTTFRTLCADASSSNWPSAAVSACRKMSLADGSHCRTVSLK